MSNLAVKIITWMIMVAIGRAFAEVIPPLGHVISFMTLMVVIIDISDTLELSKLL